MCCNFDTLSKTWCERSINTDEDQIQEQWEQNTVQNQEPQNHGNKKWWGIWVTSCILQNCNAHKSPETETSRCSELIRNIKICNQNTAVGWDGLYSLIHQMCVVNAFNITLYFSLTLQFEKCFHPENVKGPCVCFCENWKWKYVNWNLFHCPLSVLIYSNNE